MDLDTNQPCPGGTGKKIKFCCKDLTRELDKIVRLMEGGQRKAAVEAIDKTLATHGDRACLYALKAEVQAEAGDAAGTKATMSAFAQKFPDNPAALADGAMAAIEDGQAAQAVDLLQSALERSGDTIEARVYAAYGVVAQGLLATGNLLAARAHLMMQADLSRGRDAAPMQMLSQIDRAPQTPLLFKFAFELDDAPEGAAWKPDFERAVEMAERGEWRRSLAEVKRLVEKQPGSAPLRKNVAMLASRLGDREAAARAWRDCGAVEGAPWEDRVEAEAMAQLLEPPRDEATFDEVKVVYPIRDIDRLTEKLLSEPRVVRYEGDLKELVDENETPPKGVFSLLDRPDRLPEDGALTVETVPNVLGEIFVYGRRTDRDARLEFETTRNERFEAAKNALAEAAGEWIGPPEAEEVTERVSQLTTALSWRWRFPPNTPAEVRRELMEQKRRELIYDRWPEIARSVLDGRTPREAAGQAAYRVRVAAAVLLVESIGEQMRWNLDFNPLREKLGLPPLGPIDPATVDVQRLPLARFSRLEVEKLSDDALVAAYNRAASFYHFDALERLAREALKRDSLGDRIDRAAAHRVLSQTARDPQDALEHLHRCREILVKRGESPASLLLEEFRLRLLTGVGVEECDRLLHQIRANHLNEPGIAQELYQTLVEFGIIGPDGRPAGAPRAPGPATQTARETAVAPAAEGSKLWTPDGPSPQVAPPAEKKSKLWMPGMD